MSLRFTQLATEDQDFVLGTAFHCRANEESFVQFCEKVADDEVDGEDLGSIWDKTAFLLPLFLGLWEQLKREADVLR